MTQQQWGVLKVPTRGGGYSKASKEAAEHNANWFINDLAVHQQTRWVVVSTRADMLSHDLARCLA